MCDVCVCCWYECAYVMCDMFAVHTACYHCVSSVAVADGKHEEQEKPVVMPGEVVQFEVGMEELESLGTLNKKVSQCLRLRVVVKWVAGCVGWSVCRSSGQRVAWDAQCAVCSVWMCSGLYRGSV